MFVPSRTVGRLGESLFDLAVKTETLALTRFAAIFLLGSAIKFILLNSSCPAIYFRIFGVPEVCVSYRLLQTVLFLTDSVFSCVVYLF